VAEKKCPRCGTEVSDKARFCPDCGKALFEHTDLTLEIADPRQVLSERYIIIKALGGGATATVYLAKDTQLDEFIALKD